jgi:hypothetical protein
LSGVGKIKEFHRASNIKQEDDELMSLFPMPAVMQDEPTAEPTLIVQLSGLACHSMASRDGADNLGDDVTNGENNNEGRASAQSFSIIGRGPELIIHRPSNLLDRVVANGSSTLEQITKTLRSE